MPDTLKIGTIEIPVVSDEEAEACDCVVCATADTPTPWADNVHTTCTMCTAPIIHRPHAPQRPIKICIPCMIALSEAEQGKPN